MIWRVVVDYGAQHIPLVAGGIAFFTLLAAFPAIGAFIALYGLFFDPITAQAHLQVLSGILPSGVLDFFGQQMELAASRNHGALGFAFVLSLALSLWGANASVNSLIWGLNVAYRETERRNVFRYTLTTLTITALFLVFLLVVSALVVVAPVVASWLGWTWNGADVGVLRWPLLFAVYVGALLGLYRYGPCRPLPPWLHALPGAVVAALLSLAFSWVYSWYLSRFARYDATYGPLGAVVGFMVWAWWSLIVVLVGALLNAEIERRFKAPL